MRYIPVSFHLPLWWPLKTHGTPTAGRRAGGRRTSWWRAVCLSVLLCHSGWEVRMVTPSDACAYVSDRRDEWPPNSCIEGWPRFIKPARHSEPLWLTHASITSQGQRRKKSDKKVKLYVSALFLYPFLNACWDERRHIHCGIFVAFFRPTHLYIIPRPELWMFPFRPTVMNLPRESSFSCKWISEDNAFDE